MTAAAPGETFLQKQKRLKAEREAAERGTPAWTLTEHTGQVEQGNPRAQAWVQAKVSAQLTELATRPEGDRNDYLNNVAYSMGRLTPKWLDYSSIGNQLYDAAIACGLTHEESVATIRSGLEGGMKEPRDPPVEPVDELLPPIDLGTGEILPDPAALEDAATAVEQTLEDKPVAPTLHEQLVARELVMLRARDEAKRIYEQEKATGLFRPPPSTRTLADELLLPDEPVEYAIEELLPVGGNALLTAQYKSGKTTVLGEAARSFADGTLFLGRFAMHPAPGRMAIFNYELSPAQYRRWLRELDIQNPDKVAVLHLRGFRLDLRTSFAQDWCVRWLEEREVSMWAPDPFARAATGVEENSNAETGEWLDTLDIIKERAGVRDLILPNHTGREKQEHGEERGRGATRLDDWADVRWLLTKDKDGNRFFRATGRDVELAEERLTYNDADRSLRFGGGDKRRVAEESIDELVVQWVRQHPTSSQTEVEKGVEGKAVEIRASLKRCVRLHRLRVEDGPRNARLFTANG